MAKRLCAEPQGNLYHEISERTFTAQVIEMARRFGWMVAHFRPAMTQRGRWVTAVQGDGAGFPDLVLSRGKEVIFAELKTRNGKTSKAQERWLESLGSCAYVGAVIWRPHDISDIERILR